MKGESSGTGLALALFCSLLMLACVEDEVRGKQAPQEVFVARVPPQQPALPRPSLQLIPDDLSTGVRVAQATLLLPRKVSQAEEEMLHSALSLVRWPSRETLQTTMSVEQQDMKAGSIVSRITIASQVPLGPGWYAAGADLSVLPSEMVGDLNVADSPWPGHLVTRFATHQVTAVTAIDVEDSKGQAEITLRFSSRVRDTRPGNAVVRVLSEKGGSALPCQSFGDEDLRSDDGTYKLALRCPSASFGTLTVVPDLRSLSGVPLGDVYGGALEVALAGDRDTHSAALARAMRF